LLPLLFSRERLLLPFDVVTPRSFAEKAMLVVARRKSDGTPCRLPAEVRDDAQALGPFEGASALLALRFIERRSMTALAAVRR
jgi:hypothetical protein